MYYKIFKPSPGLSHLVHFFWIYESDTPASAVTPIRVVPNGSPNMVFHYGERTLHFLDGNKQPAILLSGQDNQYYDVVSGGSEKFVFVLLNPTAGCFFNFPFSDITGKNIALDDVMPFDKTISEALAEEPDYQKKINLVEDFLSKFCLTGNIDSSLRYNRLNASLSVINSHCGIVGVDSLSDAACLSYKQFDRVFLSNIGIHPKMFLQIVRLQYAFKLLSERPSIDIQDLAFLCGFYDVPHFSKTFKQLTGYSPAKAKKECNLESDYFLTA